jgi:hypothetical protein
MEVAHDQLVTSVDLPGRWQKIWPGRGAGTGAPFARAPTRARLCRHRGLSCQAGNRDGLAAPSLGLAWVHVRAREGSCRAGRVTLLALSESRTKAP